jgi:predicted signal transduction protein with EAL and GGDEF domain
LEIVNHFSGNFGAPSGFWENLNGETIEQFFQQADKALLEAKRSGKNRIYLVGKPQSNSNEID